MSQQTPGQRWSSLVLLAVFLSLFLYYGLPAVAFRIGRAIEAGQRFEGAAQSFDSPGEVTSRDERSAPFVRASRNVRPGVVRISALLPLDSASNAAEAPDTVHPVRQSRGCGMVVDPQGLAVTSNRVVNGATQIHILVATDERPIPARMVGSDAGTDLALLKFTPPAGGVAAVDFSGSGEIETGDFVVAVGHAYQPGDFLWVGVVNSSGRRASPACCDAGDCLQTSAANHLNCGAPLVNLHGSIVGINTSFRTGHGFPLGLALPAATAREAVSQLRRRGTVTRGWLGVFIHTASLSRQCRRSAAVPEGSVALAVDYVVPGSPADAAGVRAGDVILRLDGAPVFSTAVVRKQIARAAIDAVLVVTLARGDGVEEAQVVIGPEPATPPLLPGEKEWGLRLMSHLLSDAVENGNDDGPAGVVVQQVAPRCQTRGLSPRDTILSVNGVPTPSLEVFCREVSRLRERGTSLIAQLEVSSPGSPPRRIDVGSK